MLGKAVTPGRLDSLLRFMDIKHSVRVSRSPRLCSHPLLVRRTDQQHRFVWAAPDAAESWPAPSRKRPITDSSGVGGIMPGWPGPCGSGNHAAGPGLLYEINLNLGSLQLRASPSRFEWRYPVQARDRYARCTTPPPHHCPDNFCYIIIISFVRMIC